MFYLVGDFISDSMKLRKSVMRSAGTKLWSGGAGDTSHLCDNFHNSFIDRRGFNLNPFMSYPSFFIGQILQTSLKPSP